MVKTSKERRQRRKLHIRKKLSGTMQTPRVYLFKSNKYMYVSATDDVTGKVFFTRRTGKNVEESSKVGMEIGKELGKMKVEKAVFDRSGYKYHGKVKAVAEGIRESGIQM